MRPAYANSKTERGRMSGLFQELRRRKVFRVAGAYGVVGWLLAQIAATLESAVGLPDWFDGMVVSLLLIGFPIAVILAWAFDLTPEGVRLTADVAAQDGDTPATRTAPGYLLAGGLAVLIAAGIAVWRLLPSQESVPAAAPEVTRPEIIAGQPATAVDSAAAASIAVLPFADLSQEGDQTYFSDGIAEEILNALANVQGLSVASRTSSFAFRDRDGAGIPAIAAELKVRHVLEGSVRKAGASLRITAQLIDATNDRHLWSQSYDRPLTTDNVFAIQEEIAGAIVAALGGVMGMPGTALPTVEVVKSTADLSAYDLYLRSRALYQRREHMEEADALVARAIERDPAFADAWALRAAIRSLYNEYVPNPVPYEENESRVDDYAARALALDSDNARAIAARANFRMVSLSTRQQRQDIGAAIADLERAVTLDPRDSSAMNWLGQAYTLVGNTPRALEVFAACAAFDPLFGPCAENHYDSLVVHGRYDEAWAEYQQVLAKGMVVSGWVNFFLLARLEQKAAFMLASNHPAWLPEWRRHDELYEAFRHIDEDHRELLADLLTFASSRPKRGLISYNMLLIPLGGFDVRPSPEHLWAPDYAAYRRSPQFKAFIRGTGIHAYWHEHGFPLQCRPIGPQSDDTGDFACD